MAFTIKELRETQDEVLIAQHDKRAANTVVGVDYYLDELRRREQLAAMKSSEKLARAALLLSVANLVVAVVAIVVAVAT